MRPAVHAPDIHGESGIDGTNLLPSPPPHIAVQPGNAIMAMYNAVMKTTAGTCVIVATGTLTNVALLFATFPEVVKHIKELSMMGGAFGERPDSQGNITKWAEFNIYVCSPSLSYYFVFLARTNCQQSVTLNLHNQFSPTLCSPTVSLLFPSI